MPSNTKFNRSKLTLENAEKICQLLLEKAPHKEICEQTGVSLAMLEIYVNFLAYNGKEVFIDHYINNNKPQYTHLEYCAIVECMVINHLTYSAICAMFRTHKDPIKKRFDKRGNTPLEGVTPAAIPPQVDSPFNQFGLRAKKVKPIGKDACIQSLDTPAYVKQPYKGPCEQSDSKPALKFNETGAVHFVIKDEHLNSREEQTIELEVDERGFDKDGTFRGRAQAPIVKHGGKWKNRTKATVENLKSQEKLQYSIENAESKLVTDTSELSQVLCPAKLNPNDFIVLPDLEAKDWTPDLERKGGRPRDINVFSDGFDALPLEVQVKALMSACYSLVGQCQATCLAYEIHLGNEHLLNASGSKKKLLTVDKSDKFDAINLMREFFPHKYSVAQLCAFVDAKPMDLAYYNKNLQKPDEPDHSKDALKQAIFEIFTEIGNGRWGQRRIAKYMRTTNILKYRFNVSAHTVGKYMKELGLSVVGTKVDHRKTNSYKGENENIVPNHVDRCFSLEESFTLLVTDVSEEYVVIGNKQIKYFFSPIYDVGAEKFLTFTVAVSSKVAVICESLKAAVRKIPKDGKLHILHSDRGNQYFHQMFVQICAEANITRSMSNKGCCIDNAVIESQFNKFKRDVIRGRKYSSEDQFLSSVESYVDAVNSKVIPSIPTVYSDRPPRPVISSDDDIESLKSRQDEFHRKRREHEEQRVLQKSRDTQKNGAESKASTPHKIIEQSAKNN